MKEKNYGGLEPEEWAATKLQARWRGVLARRNRVELVNAATVFQAQWRGYWHRKTEKSAIIFQAQWRGYQARKQAAGIKHQKLQAATKRADEHKHESNMTKSYYFGS